MKQIACFIALFLVMGSAIAQRSALVHFYKEQKTKETTGFRFVVPGVLIRLGTKIASNHVADDPAAYQALRIAHKIRKVRIMVLENSAAVPKKEVVRLTEKLRNRYQIEELMTVSSDGTEVRCLANTKKGRLRNIILLVADAEEGDLVILQLKSRMRLNEIGELIEKAMEMDKKQDEKKERKQSDSVAL